MDAFAWTCASRGLPSAPWSLIPLVFLEGGSVSSFDVCLTGLCPWVLFLGLCLDSLCLIHGPQRLFPCFLPEI